MNCRCAYYETNLILVIGLGNHNIPSHLPKQTLIEAHDSYLNCCGNHDFKACFFFYSQVPTPAPDDSFEDERIEADQQLDPVKEGETKGDNTPTAVTPDTPKVNFQIVDKDESKTDGDKKTEGDTGTKDSSSKTPQKAIPKKKEIEKTEYKKPKVASRLADYIKQPVPELTEEEKLERAKNRKNKLQKNVKKVVKENKEKSESEERYNKKVEKEPPKIIKRTPPKSKWDAVMNKIDSSQSAPPKPKSEVKSKLQEYLSTPSPAKKEPEIKQPKKISNMPTPDYSKIKSKLSISGPPPPMRRAESTDKRKSKLPPPGVLKRKSSMSSVSNASSLHKLDLNESGSGTVFHSAVNSARSSISDIHKAGQQNDKENSKQDKPSSKFPFIEIFKFSPLMESMPHVKKVFQYMKNGL